MHALVQGTSRARLAAFVVFCIALPLLSFVLRVRRLRSRAHASLGGTAEEVRRRLRGVEGKVDAGSLVRHLWTELVRATRDTVLMGGRGLV